MIPLIAHRGASFDAPENTLAAIRLGWQQADVVEIDVRLTRDGTIVALHDATTQRTTGVDKNVENHNFSELRQLDAGGWKAPVFTGEKIPALEEIVAAMPAGKRLVIEVKCGVEIIPALSHCLKQSGKSEEQFIFFAFSVDVIEQLKKNFPQIEAYLLCGVEHDESTQSMKPAAGELIAIAQAAGLDGLSLKAHNQIDAVFVRQIKTTGLKCLIWTVDSPDEARRLAEAGVDGIITNRPGWLRHQLQTGGGASTNNV